MPEDLKIVKRIVGLFSALQGQRHSHGYLRNLFLGLQTPTVSTKEYQFRNAATFAPFRYWQTTVLVINHPDNMKMQLYSVKYFYAFCFFTDIAHC